MSKEEKTSPKVKDILDLLAKGILLSSLFIFPGAAIGIKAIYDQYEKIKREKELKILEKYNINRLRYILRRLHQQKLIEVIEEGEYSVIKLTQKGEVKTLKYKFEEMSIEKQKSWDKKWRLIIYDIAKVKKSRRDAFRRMLVKLNLLQLQKSIYMTPYPCDKEIEFLREYFGVGEGVLYVVAEYVENEDIYKRYFGL